MSSFGIFIGTILTVLSVGAAGFSHELRMLGFKNESKMFYQLSMFLALIGFILIIAAYPSTHRLIHPAMPFF